MKGVGIYAGSFDPVTNGHTDLIRRGAVLFDELVVAVGNNPNKRYWFDLETREQHVRSVCADIGNVRVVRFSGLLVEAARRENASVILRGLRALSDFDTEFRYGLANRDLSGIETVFLITDPQCIFIASSLVKEIAVNGGDVSRYVAPAVLAAIRAKAETR